MVELFKKPPEEKEAKKGGLFSKAAPPSVDTSGIEQDVEGAVSRVRVLEERFSDMRQEMKLVEENIIKKNKQMHVELRHLFKDISEFKREMTEVNDRVLMMVKELESFAKREDFQILKKYVDMWEPLNFVTHNELKEALQEHKGKDHSNKPITKTKK